MKKLLFLLFTLFALNATLFAQKNNDHVAGDFLISISQDADIQRIVQRLQTFEGVPTQLKVAEKIADPMNIWRLTFNFNDIDEEEMLYLLRSQPDVRVAQYNHTLEQRAKVPNDSLFAKQWQWNNTGQTGGKKDADVDAPEAWEITTGGLTSSGDTIVVAVIDDGTDPTHPDLVQNLWRNNQEIPNNKIDDDGNGYVDDYLGWNHALKNDKISGGNHGVNVNGMIGARGNNKQGVSGINWNVKIMNITPFPSSTNEATVIAAYSYAYTMRKIYNQSKGKKGAFVVATNLSWGKDYGQPADAPIWCAFYDTLGTVGILSVAATNNSVVDIDAVSDLPTACPSDFMLSVLNTNASDGNASGYGQKTIDIGAPGSSIYTTAANGKFTNTSGTSFASPLVAGIVALAYSSPCAFLPKQAQKDPAQTALNIKKYIIESADAVAALSKLNVAGGRANAFNTLQTVAAYCSSCVAPSLEKQVVNGTTIKVDWSLPDSVINVNIRWKATSATTWKQFDKKAGTFTLDSLLKNTDYEVQFQSNCANNIKSAWSKSFVIKTSGGCEVPVVGFSNFTKTSIDVEWDAVTTVKSYDVRYRKIGTTGYTTVSATKSPFTITPLDSCASYEIQMRTVCDATTTTAWSTAKVVKTYGCGTCLDLPYCKVATFSATFEYIKKVKFNTINKTSSGSANGYGNYVGDAKKTQVLTGSSYDLQLIAGFSSPAFPSNVYFRTWIDYNQDGVFDPNDELVYDAGKTVTTDTLNGIVNIPWDAKEGNTRMRVGMRAVFGGALTISPCDSLKAYGEFEDYCINIVSGFKACGKIKNLNLSVQAGETSISWDTIPGAISYNVRYRKFGDMDWKVENTAKKFFKINGTQPCVKYEIEVRTICMNDISDFSDTKVAEYCPVATKETDQSLTLLNVYPVPFSNALFTAFILQESSNVKIEIFNAAGQKMTTQNYENLAASRHEYRINEVENWATGLYWIKISTAKGNTMKKIMKIE